MSDLPKSSAWGMPATAPDGRIMTHMSARMRRQVVDQVFEDIGGRERMGAWAQASNDNLTSFYKMWAAGQAKHVSAELEVPASVEDALRQLDAGEHARVVNDPVDAEVIDE